MSILPRSPQQQLEVFRGLLSGKQLRRDDPAFPAALHWMRTFPGDISPGELKNFRGLVCTTFSLTEVELDEALSSKNGFATPGLAPSGKGVRYTPAEMERSQRDEKEFDNLVPKCGFFRRYIEYTKESEAPIAFHFFTAVVGLAATINRRVGFNFGPVGRIYPPLGIILLGPSGIKKTSSADIMVSMLTELGVVPLYSEKVTPEALVEGMSKGQATGLIYAPEMAVFLGKASYMEGIVPLLTRLMDSPDKWVSSTIARGQRTLSDVALSSLMCSTADWFVANTPADMFGGGFIARNLLIHQTISPRIIPIPKARDEKVRLDILNLLTECHQLTGEMNFSHEAEERYEQFYRQNKLERPEHEMLEAYSQRKPTHSIRLAMLLHLSSCGTMEICADCYNRALQILEWTEQYLPGLLQSMFRSESGVETETVLRVIRAGDGEMQHSKLIRKLQYKYNAQQIKKIIDALHESGQITINATKFHRTYSIKEEE